jgi:L,D-peptidoglycan transpeptidase YkuD (ErfK/YbiS/YcfS/YnhG family)
VIAPTEAPTDATPQSGDFNRLAKAAGINSATVTAKQLIFVETSGTSATVYTYEKDSKGKWNEKFSPMQGYTGEGGASETSVPYDSVTPKGVFNIEFAIGTNPDPGTALSYNQIVYGMRWITDPNSVNYNRLIDGDATLIDFTECQDLYEYTRSYPYAVIFDYNRNPVDTSKGSAKFLHVGYAPTYGGVGIAETDLYNIMLWLDPANSPQIAIF